MDGYTVVMALNSDSLKLSTASDTRAAKKKVFYVSDQLERRHGNKLKLMKNNIMLPNPGPIINPTLILAEA